MIKERFKEIYQKLYKEKENFIDLMEGIINKLDKKNQKYVYNKKYTIKDYVKGIIEVLSNNISWRKYNGLISGRVLNNKHNYYVKIGVYEELYKTNLEEYIKSPKRSIKLLSLDSRS